MFAGSFQRGGVHLAGVWHTATLAHHGGHGFLHHAAFAHLFHHVRHLAVHLQQLVQLRDFKARTCRDPLFAGRLQDRRVGALFLGHRVDQSDLPFEDAVIHPGFVHLLGHFAHAGHHAHDAFHAAHLLHLLQLALQVVHVEQALLEALHHALLGLDLHGFLRLLDQRDDVAHAKNAARDARRLKGFDGVHLFAKTDETDGLAGDGPHREGRAAATVTVHPGQNNTGNADLAVEVFGRMDRVLASQAVNHQKRFAGVCHVADSFDLSHQLFVDRQAPCGVEHIDIKPTQGGLLLGALCDLNRGLALDDRQCLNADLGAKDCQLFHRGGTVYVERCHQHALALTLGQALGQLCGGGGLTRTL